MKVFVSYQYNLGNRAQGFGNFIFEKVEILEDYSHFKQLQDKINENLNNKYDCKDANSIIVFYKVTKED